MRMLKIATLLALIGVGVTGCVFVEERGGHHGYYGEGYGHHYWR